MKIVLNPLLLQHMPSFKIGIVYYTKITVSPSPQMLKGRLQLFQEQLYFELQDHSFSQRASIQEWHNVWKVLGIDPSQHPSSIELLFQKINLGSYLEPIHTAIDLNNFFSLRYEIPVSIYDAAKIGQAIDITVGQHQDAYTAFNQKMHMLHQLIIFKDHQGPFGSPFIDSTQTTVSEKTTSCLQLFLLRPSMALDEAHQLMNASAQMFTNISGGDANTNILHAKQQSIHLP